MYHLTYLTDEFVRPSNLNHHINSRSFNPSRSARAFDKFLLRLISNLFHHHSMASVVMGKSFVLMGAHMVLSGGGLRSGSEEEPGGFTGSEGSGRMASSPVFAAVVVPLSGCLTLAQIRIRIQRFGRIQMVAALIAGSSAGGGDGGLIKRGDGTGCGKNGGAMEGFLIADTPAKDFSLVGKDLGSDPKLDLALGQ